MFGLRAQPLVRGMPWYGDPALLNRSYNSKKAVPNGSTPVSGMAARTIEVLPGGVRPVGPAGVDCQPEVEAGRDLVVVQVRDPVVGVVGHSAVPDPCPDLCHVVLAVDARQLAEHVRPELRRIGADDPVVLVDPDNRGDVAYGVELGELVLGVHQHRVGDLVGEWYHRCDVLVERDGDDCEAVVSQLVMQCLPPGQVEGTSSPAGEGDQQASGARPFREPPLCSMEVQKRGIGCLSGQQCPLSL